jgi:ubiquinone/menaquinone biosynthesis C-methylase UbiE
MSSPSPIPEGQFFDQLVDEDGDFNPFTDRGWRTLAQRFHQASGGAKELHVLDIGCGTGNSHGIYASQAARYTGLDLSLGALRKARQFHRDLTWLQADGAQLPFPAGTFDLVAFSSVLHHMDDINAALTEARRVLAPGGMVFAFDPNLLHPAMLLFRHPRSPLYRPEGVSPHERPLLPSRILEAFRVAGFSDIGQRCQSDISYRHVGPRFLRPWLSLYNAIDRVWESVGAGRWLGTFVTTWARTPR